MPEWIQVASSGGALGIALLFLYGFYKGWWRTAFEVKVYEDRVKFLEDQLNRILPALEKLSILMQTHSEDMIKIESKIDQVIKILEEDK